VTSHPYAPDWGPTHNDEPVLSASPDDASVGSTGGDIRSLADAAHDAGAHPIPLDFALDGSLSKQIHRVQDLTASLVEYGVLSSEEHFRAPCFSFLQQVVIYAKKSRKKVQLTPTEETALLSSMAPAYAAFEAFREASNAVRKPVYGLNRPNWRPQFLDWASRNNLISPEPEPTPGLDVALSAVGKGPIQLRCDEIDSHPDNPRLSLHDHVILPIVESLKSSGKFEPRHAISVRRVGLRFQVLSGHHRLEAAKQARLEDVFAYVTEKNDVEALLDLATSNNQEALTPLEHALHSIRLEAFGVSQREYAVSCGFDPANLNRYRRGAEVFLKVKEHLERCNVTICRTKAEHLAAIHKAPEELWLPLVQRCLGEEWSKKLTVDTVAGYLRVPATANVDQDVPALPPQEDPLPVSEMTPLPGVDLPGVPESVATLEGDPTSVGHEPGEVVTDTKPGVNRSEDNEVCKDDAATKSHPPNPEPPPPATNQIARLCNRLSNQLGKSSFERDLGVCRDELLALYERLQVILNRIPACGENLSPSRPGGPS